MKFFRLDLLTLLISLFILNSCKNQDTIGLNHTSGLVSGTLTDTATVNTNTTYDDQVYASGLTKSPMGYLVDPIFGTTEANLVTDLNLPLNTAYTVPKGNITIDSVVLVLKYADGFYGDSSAHNTNTSKYKINVYQMGERPLPNQNYYANKAWLVNRSQAIDTSGILPIRPTDSVKIQSIVPGGKDTFKKVAPQLRVRLKNTFIRSILFNAPGSLLASNLVFKNTVKGLFVTVDKTQSTGAGGTAMFQAPADSAVQIYVRIQNGTTTDTTQIYMGVGAHASQIIHIYPDAIKADINDSTHSSKVMYLQGLAGLRGKISFPYLKDLFKSIGNNNVVINRAELVVTPDPASLIPTFLKPAPRLTLYRYDIAHQRISVEDASTSDTRYLGAGIFGGYYNLATNDYHFLITAYIQDLVSSRTSDYGTYISPIDSTSTSSIPIAATPQVGGRTLAIGNDKSKATGGSNPKKKGSIIRLNVIYTKINKQ